MFGLAKQSEVDQLKEENRELRMLAQVAISNREVIAMSERIPALLARTGALTDEDK